jgi:hypothetical protein
MKNDEMFYGRFHSDDDSLKDTIEAVIIDMMERACEDLDENFDRAADKISWPVTVYEFRRVPVDTTKNRKEIAQRILVDTQLWLDEHYGDPDRDDKGHDETPQAVKDAAMAFAEAALGAYVPYQFEHNRVTHHVTREEAAEYW